MKFLTVCRRAARNCQPSLFVQFFDESRFIKLLDEASIGKLVRLMLTSKHCTLLQLYVALIGVAAEFCCLL